LKTKVIWNNVKALSQIAQSNVLNAPLKVGERAGVCDGHLIWVTFPTYSGTRGKGKVIAREASFRTHSVLKWNSYPSFPALFTPRAVNAIGFYGLRTWRASIEKQYQQLARTPSTRKSISFCFSPAGPSDVTLAAPQIQHRLRRTFFISRPGAKLCVILRMPIRNKPAQNFSAFVKFPNFCATDDTQPATNLPLAACERIHPSRRTKLWVFAKLSSHTRSLKLCTHTHDTCSTINVSSNYNYVSNCCADKALLMKLHVAFQGMLCRHRRRV
jgi:hypothetical protein